MHLKLYIYELHMQKKILYEIYIIQLDKYFKLDKY